MVIIANTSRSKLSVSELKERFRVQGEKLGVRIMRNAKNCSMRCTGFRNFEVRISKCEFYNVCVKRRSAVLEIRNPQYEIEIHAA